MADIILHKKNNVYFKVETSPAVAMELSEFFTFMTPDAHFHPLVKAKKWDGKLKLYNLLTKELYIGLLSHLKVFCKDMGYSLAIPKGLTAKKKIKPEQIVKWVEEKIQPTDEDGKQLDVRPYQYKAIAYALRDQRKILLSPTGSGKSLIAYIILRYLCSLPEMKGKRILLMVPRVGLVNQMISDFKEYSQRNGWDVDKNVHPIYGGQEKLAPAKIYVSTWQSIYDIGLGYFKQFGAVICDEVHEAEAKSIKGILEVMDDASYRIGMTGTLKNAKTHRLTLEGLFGKIVRVEHTHKMQERGELADLDIHMMFLKHPPDQCKALAQEKKEIDESNLRGKAAKKYFAEMEHICANERRNIMIKNLALKQKGNCLVLFQFVEKHGFILRDLIERDAKGDRKIFFVYQGTSAKQREEIRKIVAKEKDAIIVASYGTFSTGINIKNISSIIFASPSKSKIRVLQSIGRGLRIALGKLKLDLFDLTDDYTYKGKENYTLQHAEQRLEIYNDERFKYKIYRLEV